MTIAPAANAQGCAFTYSSRVQVSRALSGRPMAATTMAMPKGATRASQSASRRVGPVER